MPWLTLPWEGSQELRQELSRQFGVNGIPFLVILTPGGEVVNGNARASLLRDQKGEEFPWPGGASLPAGWVPMSA